MEIITWILGILGVSANFIVYQQKERKQLLIAKMACDFLWACHYASLFAWSGSAICLIGLCRSIVFFNEHKKWANGKKWLIIFLVLGVISTILTWKNAFSILTGIVAVLSVISFWQSNSKISKMLSYPISWCMVVYDIACLSYIGLLNEAFVQISSTISLIGMKKKQKEYNKKQ